VRILVAEDERITRRSLERQLERWGHEVVGAEDGEAAWELFAEGGFDIVVTDWEMPRTNGVELVRRIRANGDGDYAYIVMLTARTEKIDVVEGMDAGADDFLSKPVDRDELRARLSAGERVIELERRLASQNRELNTANARLHRDLEAAARVQQELLPKSLPEEGPIRFAWRYKPCDELGGDLLNVVPLVGNSVAMYLADVSGHGVASSLVSVSVHRTLSIRDDSSSIILSGEGPAARKSVTPPDEVADRLSSLYPMDRNGGHFMTMVYAPIDAAPLRLEYCAAGHPGPIISRRGEPVRSCESTGVPLGIIPDPDYESHAVDLRAGDRVFVFSDGLLESMNAENELFGIERIEETIEETREFPIDEAIDTLVQRATAWQGSESFADDLSILAFDVLDG